MTQLIELFGNNPLNLRDQALKNYRSYTNAFIQTDIISLRQINKGLNFIKQLLPQIDTQKKENATKLFENVELAWEELKSHIPLIFYRRSNKVLKNSYTYEEAKKELDSSNSQSLLKDFLRLLEIQKSDFLSAVSSGSSGPQLSIRNKIKKKVDNIINKGFNAFYNVESISLDLDFNANSVTFALQSNEGEMLLLSERSNGLRWYLNTYIDAMANGMIGKNVVYLFDEPGVYLHVNAQKEILNLFQDLADKGNQVVYTTHSPYMIDIDRDGIHKIRAVKKNEEGYTFIYNTVYNSELSPNSKEDTLSPIINAIGMSLGSTIAPSINRRNIVVEGISDYIYLHTMAKYLGFDISEITFIPSQGASNCINICTILYGWGCDFIALFDYDYEGVVKGGRLFESTFGCLFGEKYCYTEEISKEDIEEKTYNSEPYVIEDVVTKEELERFKNENNISSEIGKPLMAKMFATAIENGKYKVGDECKDNFKSLIDKLIK